MTHMILLAMVLDEYGSCVFVETNSMALSSVLFQAATNTLVANFVTGVLGHFWMTVRRIPVQEQ